MAICEIEPDIEGRQIWCDASGEPFVNGIARGSLMPCRECYEWTAKGPSRTVEFNHFMEGMRGKSAVWFATSPRHSIVVMLEAVFEQSGDAVRFGERFGLLNHLY